jgi:hypothetical protein
MEPSARLSRPGNNGVYYSFNSDASCITLCNDSGLTIANSDPINIRLHEKRVGYRIAELLYCTPLLALIGSGTRNGRYFDKLFLLLLLS